MLVKTKQIECGEELESIAEKLGELETAIHQLEEDNNTGKLEDANTAEKIEALESSIDELRNTSTSHEDIDIQYAAREDLVALIPKEIENTVTLFPSFATNMGLIDYDEDICKKVKTEGKVPWDAIDFSYVTKSDYLLGAGNISNNLMVAPKMINTENVETFLDLFQHQIGLVSVQAFDSLESCLSLNGMFDACENLAVIPDFPKMKDGADCSFMFYKCKKLGAAPVIPGYIGKARCMFMSCEALGTVPEYNLSKCTDISKMFSGCGNLIGEFPWEIDMSSITSSAGVDSMFKNTRITKVTFKNVPQCIQELTPTAIASAIGNANIVVTIKNTLE